MAGSVTAKDQIKNPFSGIKNTLFYVSLIGICLVVVWLIAKQGASLEDAGTITKAHTTTGSGWLDFKSTSSHNLIGPLSILLMQIVTIIVAAGAMGYIFRKLRQPAVIGEIIAGILLGPSLVGHYFPEFSAFLFPKASMPNLQILSQIGLIMFMFVVGMELDLKVLKNKAHEAIVISHASIVIPFTLGVGAAYFFYQSFAPAGTAFLSFALFMGIAMSITAFPVLARIVQERQLTKTRLGSVAITCAAADDITAWCLLAVVIAVVKAGSYVSALYTIGFAILYVVMMVFVVRPFLKRVGDKYADRERLSKPIVSIFFITLLLSAYMAELIGIHALFGAFMAGVIMPANINFRNIFIEKVEDVAVVLLLPLFFVFTGLRTQIGLLDDISLWKSCAIIIVIAVTGKFIGSSLAAKFVGQPWRDSLIIGALMNTRGLMELVALNIGYDLGILTPEIFAMLVIMALVTTFMTGPSLDLINYFLPERKRVAAAANVVHVVSKFKILIPFGSAKSGRAMLRLAAAFTGRSKETTAITALHLTPSSEVNQYNIDRLEKENFIPVEEEAAALDMEVDKRFKPSQDIIREVIKIANDEDFDLMLIGTSRSIFEGTLLGNLLGFTSKLIEPERLYKTLTFQQNMFQQNLFDERTQDILDNTKVPTGIFINKEFTKANKVLLPMLGINDQLLLIYAKKLILNNDAEVWLMDNHDALDKLPELQDELRRMAELTPGKVKRLTPGLVEPETMQQFDLLLMSYSSWKTVTAQKEEWLKEIPSALIIKP